MTRTIHIAAHCMPEVFCPVDDVQAEVELKDGVCTITLPKACSYILAQFPKN